MFPSELNTRVMMPGHGVPPHVSQCQASPRPNLTTVSVVCAQPEEQVRTELSLFERRHRVHHQRGGLMGVFPALGRVRQ